MALTKCKECNKEVSTGAKTCPSCGIGNPGAKKTDQVLGLFLLIAIAGFVVWACSPSETKPKVESSVSEQNPPNPEDSARVQQAAAIAAKQHAAAEDAKCKSDLQCWGDKNIAAVGAYCKKDVERLAKYSVRWTDEMFEQKFSRFRWLDKDAGTLTFVGDRIDFQNGFGAYQAHIYECDFDPSTKTVLDVRAHPGRL